MKVTLPENIADISLDQYQKYYKLTQRDDLDDYNFNKRKIEIFTGISFRDVDSIKQVDYEDILKHIDKALNQDAEFINRFKIGSVEFGFIPNFDKLSTAEFADLSKHGIEVENLHKVMAVLFRPITEKDFLGNYKIATYDGTSEFSDIMKQTPMNVVNGALVFFCSLANELKNYIQKSTPAEQEREAQRLTTLLNGDGTPL
jgi:hypothetical protein